MVSIHTERAIKKARKMGAYAGNESAAPLWSLSKRELVEVALRLGVMCGGDFDGPEAGAQAALNEYEALKKNGIL